METVIACVQQAPSGSADDDGTVLELRDLVATGESYLEAVQAVEAQVPDGWRILYVRSSGVSADEPLRGGDGSVSPAGPSVEPTASS